MKHHHPSCRRQRRSRLHLHLLVLAVLAAAPLALPRPAPAQASSLSTKVFYLGAVTRHPDNRRYFMTSNTCDAIYLAGTHDSGNVQDFGTTYPPSPFNFSGTYPPADAPQANFIRGWHWEGSRYDHVDPQPSDWILPLAFARTGPGNAYDGKPRFNLNQYDGSYVSRLQSRAATAASKGMILSLMLFQGFSVQNLNTGEYPWLDHPFRSGNNVNGINGDWTTAYAQGGELHTLDPGKSAAIKNAQENYVRHIVDNLNGYKNIFWEVSNESNGGSLSWQNSIAAVIRSREAGLPNKHLVWISAPWHVSNVAVYNSSADVVSPSWRQPAVTATGGTVPGTYYRTDPPVTSGAKIVILDTDHLGAPCDWCTRAWVWKAFTRGYHIALLDEATTPNPTRRKWVREAIDDTRAYSKKIGLLYMAPQSESQSTPCSTRYCLFSSNDPDPQPYAPAVPNGNEYLVFKPSTTDRVTIYSLPAGDYSGEWARVDNGSTSAVAQFTHAGGNRTLISPYGTTEAALWLKRSNVLYLCLR